MAAGLLQPHPGHAMTARPARFPPLRLAAAAAFAVLAGAAAGGPAAAQTFEVASIAIDDLKAVFGTVESVDEVTARARLTGTVDGIEIDEGSQVEAGDMLARVVDDTLPQQLAAIGARIAALEAQLGQAETDLARVQRLRETGTATEARLDEATTQVTVLTAEIAAAEAERDVVQAQMDQEAVLAPVTGRVLSVPVVNGEVVLPGEVIAEIASDVTVLRITLPERHARFIREGDPVLVGAGGLQASAGDDLREGTVRQVYPRIAQGRVEADVAVGDLGDFFIGERTRVFVSAGERQAIVVPVEYVYSRYGVDFVRLEGGEEIPVRVGQAVPELAFRGPPVPGGVEVLSGLHPGDVIVPPEGAGTAEP